MTDGEALDAIARRLRLATSSSRVTIRLRDGERYPVAAESCVEGVSSLRHAQIDPRGSGTFAFLSTERRVLVQDDVLAHELSTPPEIVRSYGLRAQMIAPVIAEDELVALISVHEVTRTRSWSASEQAALHRATGEVEMVLARDGRQEENQPSPLRP